MGTLLFIIKDTIVFPLDKRIQMYMKSLLCLPCNPKSMPPVPGGLGVIQQELEVLGCQYANIVNHNKQVYGPFYANIFRQLLFRNEAVGKIETSLPANWREAGTGKELEISTRYTVSVSGIVDGTFSVLSLEYC